MEYKEMVDTAPLTKLVDNIGVRSVFGEPKKENGTVIIPVAQVEYGFGYGGGFGSAVGEEDSAGEKAIEAAIQEKPGEGGGGGGGAAGRATPRGYIHITPDEVRYEPITDDERVSLLAILMVAWSVFWITLTIRTLAKAVERVKRAQG
jgi:uncharacterized spore protein YtfJ